MKEERRISADPAQRAAIRQGSGPCAVIAGPGSGKTYVIVERIRWLIGERGIAASSILVLTFSRAAAVQMRTRFLQDKQAGSAGRDVVFGTFHAVFYQIVRESLPQKLTIINAAAKRSYLQHLCDMRPVLDDYEPGAPQSTGEKGALRIPERMTPDELRHLISCCKNGLPCGYPWVPALVREYDRYLAGRGWIDFDDMILLCRKLLKENPAILAKWQSRFSWILVDEFQDVSPLQYEILLLLAAPQNNLFVVGDDDQSIYGFRGAAPQTMQTFLEEFCGGKKGEERGEEKGRNQGPREVFLTTNYRCGSAILEACASVIRENTGRIDKHFRSGSGITGSFSCLSFSQKEQEYAFLAGKLLSMTPDERGNTAVIFRSHAGMRGLLAVLRQNRIAFRADGFAKKTESVSPEAKLLQDLTAYYRAACDLEGEGILRADMLRIMNCPERFLSGAFMTGERMDKNMLSAVGGAEQGAVRELLADLSLLHSLSPVWSLRYLLDSVGYREYAQNVYPDADLVIEKLMACAKACGNREWDTALSKMLAAAMAGEEEGGKSPAFDGSERNCRKSGSGEKTEESDERTTGLTEGAAAQTQVRVLTMHACKGLEFDTVFLPDLNEGIIPARRSWTAQQIEEERRLLYVAMTRAKKTLVMSCLEGTGDRPAEPSRFILHLL